MSRLNRPSQGAGEHAVRFVRTQRLRQGVGLTLPALGQLQVGAADIAGRGGEVGAGVPHEDDPV
jgi:hypothetical protein